MLRAVLAISCIAFATIANAYTAVTFDDATEAYTVEVRQSFEATPEELWSVLTDVSNFAKMNNSIRYALALPPVKNESFIRVQSAVEACVWFFCHSTKQLQDFYDQTTAAQPNLVAIAVPEEGIYQQLDANWLLIEEDEQTTQLQFTLLIKPDFWVPPLIGPWIIEEKIAEEAAESISAINQILATQ